MRTVVIGPRPAELEALIERRRALGQDLYDEVWNGEYHMAPAPHPFHGFLDGELTELLRSAARGRGLVFLGPFNLGAPDDYRVPDAGLHRELPTTTFVPTAALVVEIVSPGDETWDKLGFYAERGVGELLIADPCSRTVTWLALDAGAYAEVTRSEALDVEVGDLVARIDWP